MKLPTVCRQLSLALYSADVHVESEVKRESNTKAS